MKVTHIIKDVTEQFFIGFGASITGFFSMTDAEKFSYLNKNRARFPQKIGNGQFMDTVELNSMLKNSPRVEFRLEQRRGYQLAIFTFS